MSVLPVRPRRSAGPSTAARRRRGARALGATVVCGGLVVGLLATAAVSDETAPTSAGTPGGAVQPGVVQQSAVQQRLDALVSEDRFPGVLAAVRMTKDGQVRDHTAGVGDVRTRSAVPIDGLVRIGSNTKTFTATVVLQLVQEGRVDLDAPVERYLPGLVRGTGIDGRHITVRQLLQHTSGLPDYAAAVYTDPTDLTQELHTYFEPRDLLDLGLGQKALFPPGTAWAYSNTNYLLAGLVVQAVTDRPVGEEITRRVIEPLRLKDTYWPGQGEQRLRQDHPRGYQTAEDGSLVDVTDQDPSAPWAAGALVSTPRDLLTFFTALVDGRLLEPEMLDQMQKTVPAPGSSVRGDERYGLGLATFTLTCGGVAWTHGGDIPGYETRNAVTSDGRGAVVAVTALPTSKEAAEHVEQAVDTALCA